MHQRVQPIRVVSSQKKILVFSIYNNYSPKWRWLVVWIIVLVYTKNREIIEHKNDDFYSFTTANAYGYNFGAQWPNRRQ